MFQIVLRGRDVKNYISAQPAPDYGLKPGTWYHVIFTYDGSRSVRGFRIYINGNVVPSYGTGDDLAPLETSVQTSSAPLLLGNQDKEFFEGGAMAGFRLLSRWTDEEDAQLLFAEDRVKTAAPKDVADLSELDRQALLDYYVASGDAATKGAVEKLHEANAAAYEIARRSAVTFMPSKNVSERPTHGPRPLSRALRPDEGRSTPKHPSRTAAHASIVASKSSWLGAMAGRPLESLDRARYRQSILAACFWYRSGENSGRFWITR